MTLNQLLKPIARLKSKELSPLQTWSRSQTDALVSTWLDANDFSISIVGVSVCLTHQRSGEEPREQIEIPRQEFNMIVQWYMRPQRLRTVKQVMRSVVRIAREIEQEEQPELI